MDLWQIVAMIASPVFAAGGAYAAVKVELRWIRRDVDDHEERLRVLEVARVRRS